MSVSRSGGRWPGLGLLVLGLGLGLLVVGGVGTYCLQHYEIVRSGMLLEWTPVHVMEIRFCEAVTLYVTPEMKLNADVMNAFLLAGAGFSAMAFGLGLLVVAPVPPWRRIILLGILFIGGSFLAADELLGLHETLGNNLPFLMEIPGVERPDDALVAVYVVAGAAVLFAFRDVISGVGMGGPAYVLALVVAATAAVSDLTGIGPEEILEVAVSALLLIAIALTGLDWLQEAAEEGRGDDRAPGVRAAAARQEGSEP